MSEDVKHPVEYQLQTSADQRWPRYIAGTLSSALNAGDGLFGTINAEVSVAAGTPGRSTERGWAPRLCCRTRRCQAHSFWNR